MSDDIRLAALKEAREAIWAEFKGAPVPQSPLSAIDRAARAVGKLINAIEYPNED